MAEGGLRLLERVFPRPKYNIRALTDLISKENTEQLPPMLQQALVVQIRNDHEFQNAPQRPYGSFDPSLESNWYELMESCKSALRKKGLQSEWYLPCLTKRSLCTACECPFIPHLSRDEWDSLHKKIRSSNMRWLLTQCIVFVLVDGRAWLQICGPLISASWMKGCLDLAFPTQVYKTARSYKRKRVRTPTPCVTIPVVAGNNSLTPSVQRPSKKFRLISGKEQRLSPTIHLDAPVRPITTSPAPFLHVKPSTSLTSIKKPKKISLIKRDASGKIECIKPLEQIIIPPQAVPEFSEKVQELAVDFKQRRRRKNNLIKRQRTDNRSGFDGSSLITHDEILYSSSGWTHFPITHPLCNPNPKKETLIAILQTSVGIQFQDQVELGKLEELLKLMGENHRAYRYTTILHNILKASTRSKSPDSPVHLDEIRKFVKHAIKSVVPVKLLGGSANQLIFISNACSFIAAGRGTSFTLNDFMQSMKTGKCQWLKHLDSLPLQVSLLARVVKWLILEWIKPLIRAHFYATETTFGRNCVFFYSKDIWQRVVRRMMHSMCSVTLRQPVAVLGKLSNNNQDKATLQSRLRFVPKRDGMRPIMPSTFLHLNRKQINTVRLLLHSISSLYTEGLDAKSTHSLHCKWVNYLDRRRKNNNSGSSYFVHADIQDAFGSVDHHKLIEILRRFNDLLPKLMQIRTWCHLSPDGRRSKNFQLIPHFYSADEWVGRLVPGSVIFDLGVNTERVDTTELLRIAIDSICQVQVMPNNKEQYKLKRGIPQGSRLSSALCHIYYGFMVQQHLSEWLTHPEDLLVRVVDDFLYLTPDLSRAQRFHKRMHEGFIDFKAYVNPAKTTTNVDFSVSNEKQMSPRRSVVWPSFCGLQFNTKTLEIRGDYRKYEGTNIIHCVTSSAGEPGQLLRQRLQAITTLKIEAIYLDARINRKATVVRSMYHACLMAAFRFHVIVRNVLMRHGRKTALNVAFLTDTVIKECCDRMIRHVHSIRRRKGVKISLNASETTWLFYEAFSRKFNKHKPLYNELEPFIRKRRQENRINLSETKVAKLLQWIGKGIPRSFRRMKDRALP